MAAFGSGEVGLEYVLGDLDLVLIMSVNPGYGGQSFIPATLRKLRDLRALMTRVGARPLVEVDGGVGLANAAELVDAGATMLVAGAAIFHAPDCGRAVEALRRAAGRR